ncbi:LPXTG cell wall anchor domain-containing protein [Spirosoma spitsbergense]|jgi:LPXTG-motif cell wall-anchored protein|uniref:LPXTG cell wall anchor domain-containing protein n=1 Tax=Spirosoma spitsbergense TaxID=431554 RepID=UPI000375CB04|nr:LPXTG cell wall anchor domain-containing protein [Spirosoma spitsbergense]
MNPNRRKIFTTALSLLLGITAGYAFLLVFFGGTGASGNTLIVIGIFFAVMLVAIALLLWRKIKSPKN